MTQTTIRVQAQAEGFHCWPDAPNTRAYLRTKHRHIFIVTAELEVLHDDREVEYHDLIDFVQATFAGGDQGANSCETMATNVLNAILAQYPNRAATVEVSEDGECSAIVRWTVDT